MPFTEITAPYNFVPLSSWIFQPDWASQVSHDLPFKEGLSGQLTLEITAHTPILVGNKQIPATNNSPGEVHFFKLPDNRYAIPGTSLKGMIRNVLEIASFGKMQFFDDRRLSIRDISGKSVIGNNYSMKEQKAGFLRLLDGGKVEITPCDFVHISHRRMEDFLKQKPYIFTKDYTPNVSQKYDKWCRLTEQTLAKDSLPTISFNVRQTPMPMAADLGSGRECGELVFTGQISDKGQINRAGKLNKNGKYRDFVFYHCKEENLEISSQVFKDFLYIHGDEDKKSKGSWRNFWRNRLFKGSSIPVFYHLDNNDEVKSIGLAYMYRLAYDASIGETIDHTNKNHRNPDGYDFADLLFGKIHPDEEHSQESLKSRVSFGLALVEGTPKFADERFSKATILNGPKPTYFPNYVRQTAVNKSRDALKHDQQYRTYMQTDSEIRGWKHYPVRRWEQVNLQALERDQRNNQNIQVKLFPLDKKTKFKSTIRFHNLRPVELGALIWTLTWGGNQELRHNLGMAKSFGFGQVNIKITGGELRNNHTPGEKIALQAEEFVNYQNLFKQLMQDKYQSAGDSVDWENSKQIRQLKAMANPANPNATKEKLKHMRLKDDNGKNQFVIAKQKGWVLSEY